MAQTAPESRPHDLTLLKSILSSPSQSSMGDEQKSDDFYTSSLSSKDSAMNTNSRIYGRMVSEENDGETHKVVVALGDTDGTVRHDKHSDNDHDDTAKARLSLPNSESDAASPRLYKSKRSRGKVRVKVHKCIPRDNSKDLQKKYEELRDLLHDQYYWQQEQTRKKLISETKQGIKLKFGLKSGQIVVRPPSATPPAGSRRAKGRVVHVGTGGADVHLVKENEIGEQYILIDATEESQGTVKHVTFHQADIHGGVLGEDRGRTPAQRIKSAPARRCKNMKERKKDRSLSRSHSSSPASTPKNDKKRDSSNDSYSSFESDNSRSRSRSRSTSREKTFVYSDHQLKNTKDPTILEWLKKKNKLLRKQRAVKRKECRAKKKKEAEEFKQKAERQEKSKEKVEEWMKDKKREMRLLKKRQRQGQKCSLKCEGETVVEEETVDLKDGSEVKDIEPDSQPEQDNKENKKAGNKQGSNEQPQGQKALPPKEGQETLKCTCGFVDQVKQKEEELRQTRLAAKQRVTSARMSNRSQTGAPHVTRSQHSPSRSKKAAVVSTDELGAKEQTAEQKRISYDDWVKAKRQEEQEKKKEKVKLAKLAESMDEDDKKLVSDVAKKRIENIKNGKKRISTGIEKVDDAANSYPESTPKSPQYLLEGEVKRPHSAQPKTKKALHLPKRPSSAHPVTSKTKPATPLSLSFPAPSRKRPKSAGKPEVKGTHAYSKVKYQQKSWDGFSDYVWDKLNEEEEGEVDNVEDAVEERPEPQGSDQPDGKDKGEGNEAHAEDDQGADEGEQVGEEGNEAQAAVEGEQDGKEEPAEHKLIEEKPEEKLVEEEGEVAPCESVTNPEIEPTASEENAEEEQSDAIPFDEEKEVKESDLQNQTDSVETGAGKEITEVKDEKHVHFAEQAVEIYEDESTVEYMEDGNSDEVAVNDEVTEEAQEETTAECLVGEEDKEETCDEVEATGRDDKGSGIHDDDDGTKVTTEGADGEGKPNTDRAGGNHDDVENREDGEVSTQGVD